GRHQRHVAGVEIGAEGRNHARSAETGRRGARAAGRRRVRGTVRVHVERAVFLDDPAVVGDRGSRGILHDYREVGGGREGQRHGRGGGAGRALRVLRVIRECVGAGGRGGRDERAVRLYHDGGTGRGGRGERRQVHGQRIAGGVPIV